MANITKTGDRNIWNATTRVIRRAWFNAQDLNTEKPPDLLSNEYLTAVNNAGTGLNNIVKTDTSDNLVFGAAINTPSGQVPVTAAPTGGLALWVGNYQPITNTSGTSTAPVANQQFISSLWVEANCTITGLAFLIGTVGGTDKAIVSLYNNAGVLVANSSVTTSGSIVGTASNLQSLAFTTPYPAVGPANYWASLQISGTTARLMTVPIGVALTAISTNATATPAASVTVPTAFATAQGPVMAAY